MNRTPTSWTAHIGRSSQYGRAVDGLENPPLGRGDGAAPRRGGRQGTISARPASAAQASGRTERADGPVGRSPARCGPASQSSADRDRDEQARVPTDMPTATTNGDRPLAVVGSLTRSAPRQDLNQRRRGHPYRLAESICPAPPPGGSRPGGHFVRQRRAPSAASSAGCAAGCWLGCWLGCCVAARWPSRSSTVPASATWRDGFLASSGSDCALVHP